MARRRSSRCQLQRNRRLPALADLGYAEADAAADGRGDFFAPSGGETAALARLEKRLPTGDPTAGYLPGADKVMVDTGSLSVRRRGLLRDAYAVVGRWTATPVLEGAELAASKRLYY